MANVGNKAKGARVRGVTKLAWMIGKPAGSSNETIEWDEFGNPVGKHQMRFSDCILAMMRASRQIKWTESWLTVDKDAKDNLWIRLQDVWDLEDVRKNDVMRIASNVFRSRKSHWKKEHYKRYEIYEERLENGPDDISYGEWAELVSYWGQSVVQELAEHNALNKSKQVVKHLSGRKSFPRRRAEMTTEEDGPLSLEDLFIETHISKATNDALDGVSREYIALMQQEAGFDENGKRQPIKDEIYIKVMPPERNGRVRMMGTLGTKTKVYRLRSNDGANTTRIQGLETQLFNVTTEISDLKRKLEDKNEEMERRIKEKDEEMERRITEHSNAIEKRMMFKFKAMFGVLSQTDD